MDDVNHRPDREQIDQLCDALFYGVEPPGSHGSIPRRETLLPLTNLELSPERPPDDRESPHTALTCRKPKLDRPVPSQDVDISPKVAPTESPPRVRTGRRFSTVWLIVCLLASGLFFMRGLPTLQRTPNEPSPKSLASAASPLVNTNIEEIRAGDVVLAYDFKARRAVPRAVTEIHRSETYHLVDICVLSETITATRYHLICFC